MLRLCSAYMPATRLSVVAGIYQCNPAIPHNDCIHPLQECLLPGLSPKTLGFKVLKAHLICPYLPFGYAGIRCCNYNISAGR